MYTSQNRGSRHYIIITVVNVISHHHPQCLRSTTNDFPGVLHELFLSLCVFPIHWSFSKVRPYLLCLFTCPLESSDTICGVSFVTHTVPYTPSVGQNRTQGILLSASIQELSRSLTPYWSPLLTLPRSPRTPPLFHSVSIHKSSPQPCKTGSLGSR